ncbi:M23 family metallopeptidase [Rhodococcus pyridinivorans]|uniref:M23 family metallopeptidase n=1 Tax=Rhodococcus sp. D-6 TaxID=1387842 RepID=A0AAU7V2Y8_9NOCA|nr:MULTISPECIES: M23 family metallopeptidase [Rhodococcus]MCD5422244.1 M23 family metallopeptidase [Rhodococcus pyridinivorans]MCT7293815.1 M23 family metallopeptidase [Rhodococcus sp. PAE-6]MCW3472161.1 M23 family metallopeptidase [Rhodococcus pyridinivorans]MDJ0401717.1 M23 family metallopeptidase [Rhodococcus rhodochrous]UGQ60448.1 M23 family metallopeptidase [Rhodococcus pyridinivorans]
MRSKGAHRRTSPGTSGRVLAVSVAAGALLAATTSSAHAASVPPTVSDEIEAASQPSAPTDVLPQAPQVLQAVQVPMLADFADQLDRARIREERRLMQEAEARRPKTLMPVSGTLTSNFGPRWGTSHYGLDIANSIGTPIVSVTDGTVLEAGPASGFGLWVRILQDDGTIGVFGHIDQALVSAGQRVRAGEQIATVGNRGQSTGPHLHYEVWGPDGQKADPMAWLNARGVQIASDART